MKISKQDAYKTWMGMISRCKYKSVYRYDRYGGRGIKVCDEWHDFWTFNDWLKENEWKKGLQIDRIDNDGDYTPDNCRIVTKTINAQNTGMYTSNKTGYKGVFKKTDCKRQKQYLAKITVDKKVISLGYFKTAVEGAIARNKFILDNNLEHQLCKIKDEE